MFYKAMKFVWVHADLSKYSFILWNTASRILYNDEENWFIDTNKKSTLFFYF